MIIGDKIQEAVENIANDGKFVPKKFPNSQSKGP